MVKKTYHTPLHVTLELPQVNSTQQYIGLITKSSNNFTFFDFTSEFNSIFCFIEFFTQPESELRVQLQYKKVKPNSWCQISQTGSRIR